MLMRCPKCLSGVGTSADAATDLHCGNCGEPFRRQEALVNLSAAEDYAEDRARCTCDSIRGCPQCFQRADILIGALVRDRHGRVWEVTDVDEKDGFPTVSGEEHWGYADEVAVLRKAQPGGD